MTEGVPRIRGIGGLVLVAVVATTMWAATPAGASRPLALTTSSAQLTVTSQPFRLAIARRRGRPVLSTMNGDRVLGAVRYAALTYTVGREHELAYPDFSSASGAPAQRYAARRVVSAARRGRALRLVLSTDDPAKRSVIVSLGSDRAGTLRIEARVSGAAGVSGVAMAFAAQRREAFHGFGGRRESTDLRGRSFQSWVRDYRYPDASTGYYAPQASFISSHGYGLLLDGDRIARWRMASDTESMWRVSMAGSALRIVVAPGAPAAAMRALTSITGRHRVAPVWSLGPMLSRTYGLLHDGGGAYRVRVEQDVARLERGTLPVSSYAFEGWAELPPDFVRGMIRRLRRRGIRTVLYLRSYTSNDIAGTEEPGVFHEALAQGYVATTATGAPYLLPSPFPGAQAAVVDFTDPAARSWWRARVTRLLDTGAEGFMNDFGEQVLPDMRFQDGATGATVHNRYPVLQARVTRQAVGAWERRHPGRHVFFFQRAGFTDRPGSAAYESAAFPGDETVDWQRATGLPSIVPDMLNRAVGGAPGFTTDIGGYAQFTPRQPVMPPTSRELFVRWSQAATLTPFFRVHNSGLDGVRMPWSYDAATLRIWAAMARLHERARPLILRLWRSFTRTGVPMTRPLWLVDPAGARGPRGDDEWLLGRDLLVAPVLHAGARSRPVRLPPGCWRRNGAGSQLRGGHTIAARVPLDQLPWYARCGTRPLGR